MNTKVISVIELETQEKKKLEVQIERIFGKKSDVLYEIDPNIIGGIVIYHGDTVVNLSVKAELTDITQNLES